MQKAFLIASFGVSLALTGLALHSAREGVILSPFSSDQPIASSCDSPSCLQSEEAEQPKQQEVLIQVVFQPNVPEIAQLSEDILDRISRQVRNYHRVEISLLTGLGDVHVLHSNRARRRIIRGLSEQLDGDRNYSGISPTPSTEQALTQGVKRLLERVKYSTKPQELHFYLVTQGTSKPEIIDQIRAITTELAEYDLNHTHVYLIGLSPENRIRFSDAFNPIRRVVKSATSHDGEWLPLIRSF